VTTLNKIDPTWWSSRTPRHAKASSGTCFISLQPLALITFKQVLAILKYLHHRFATYTKHARIIKQHLIYVIIIFININLIAHVKHKSSSITMFGCGSKSLLISESVTEIRINIHLAREQPDNTTYALPLGPYIRLPFAKSFWGRNRSSTLGTKSWFHNDHPNLSSS
jgi:hypothetical protein